MKKWKEYKYTEIASLIGGGTPKTTKKAKASKVEE